MQPVRADLYMNLSQLLYNCAIEQVYVQMMENITLTPGMLFQRGDKPELK